MTPSRKVIMTIEVETNLPVKTLRKLESLIFGCLKGDGRASIRREIPNHNRHDARGTIAQVQVNVIKAKKK